MLKIEHLRKHYANFSLDCSLSVMPGCITGLIGQNGAGKSTTFKAVLGLIATDGGDITLLGKDIRTFTAADKENLGVVLSDSGFSGYLTIGDILPVLGSLYQQFDKTFFMEQVQKAGLPLRKQIREFSTGMKAKLKVLVAISHNARFCSSMSQPPALMWWQGMSFSPSFGNTWKRIRIAPSSSARTFPAIWRASAMIFT